MSRRVLLLGGAGFIGRALQPRLAAAGWEGVTVGRGDDLEASLTGCAAVVHLACSTTPASASREPTLEGENYTLSLRLLEALIRQAGTHLVFLSSGGAIYGNPESMPVTEDAPLRPLSLHAAGKAAVEMAIGAYCAAHQRHAAILRVANAYGPGQAVRSGFGFIRALLQSMRTGMPMEIWGDGESVRDFVFIHDVADAIILALSRPDLSGTWNVGSGCGHSLNQVLALARTLGAGPIQVNYRPRRDSDVHRVVLDISRIRRDLGWAPRTGLSEGLAQSWRWLQSQ